MSPSLSAPKIGLTNGLEDFARRPYEDIRRVAELPPYLKRLFEGWIDDLAYLNEKDYRGGIEKRAKNVEDTLAYLREDSVVRISKTERHTIPKGGIYAAVETLLRGAQFFLADVTVMQKLLKDIGEFMDSGEYAEKDVRAIQNSFGFGLYLKSKLHIKLLETGAPKAFIKRVDTEINFLEELIDYAKEYTERKIDPNMDRVADPSYYL
ncbi:MAG: hypothetical protein ABH829_02175 [archaeon]